MGRILIAGLPRSGTTWLGEIVSTTPNLKYVFEPDNKELEPLARLAKGGYEVPVLAPGDVAEDYRLLWALAFAGGWPTRFHPTIGPLRRLGTASRVPKATRSNMHRRAARRASLRGPAADHVAAKSVFAYMALEWIAAEFDPAVVVVWRHPLNLVSAWLGRGWGPRPGPGPADTPQSFAAKRRFEGTIAWPPPEIDGAARLAWSLCAKLVLLLETAMRHPTWTVVSHEKQCADPVGGFTALFDRLGLDWTDDVERGLIESNAPGTGYVTKRTWSDEARGWQKKLDASDQKAVMAVVESFEAVSDVARALWRTSPAVTDVLASDAP